MNPLKTQQLHNRHILRLPHGHVKRFLAREYSGVPSGSIVNRNIMVVGAVNGMKEKRRARNPCATSPRLPHDA